MYLSEISSILKKAFSWRKLNKQTELDGSSAQSQTASVNLNNTSKENLMFSGLIQVLFFFFQTELLIRVGQSPSCKHIWQRLFAPSIQTPLISRSVHSALLRLPNLLCCHVLSAGFPFLLLTLLGLLSIGFFTVKTFKKSVFRANEDQSINTAATFKCRLVSCLVNLILLSYATITKTAFVLLNCPS